MADGQSFARATFIVTTLGTDFLRGKSATCRVSRFPDGSTDTILTWQEGLQNFTITDTVPTQGGSFPSTNGQWRGVVEPNIAIAKGDVSCDGAAVTLMITSPTFSGSVETQAGIQLTTWRVSRETPLHWQ